MSLLYKLLAFVFLFVGIAPALVGGMAFARDTIGRSDNSAAAAGAPVIAFVVLFLWLASFAALGAFFHVAACVVKYTERKR